MINVNIGNIFDSNAKTLVNTVNCVGIMGKGIAKEFKNRYPDMFKQYVKLCEKERVKPGIPYYYCDLLGASIINFPTKDHWRAPSKLSYIISGLDWFVENYWKLGITSVAFPPLGCGNGGLTWELVGPIMYNKLCELPIDIEIYAPFGTKKEYLSDAYLRENYVKTENEIIGKLSAKLNPKWLLILETIKRINQKKYNFHVGRTILQKLCFCLVYSGIEMEINFTKGKYGPYSKEIDDIERTLSNSNYMYEKKLGQMVEIHVTNDFVIDESKYSKKEFEAVNKTVDLFSRIKSTSQAEMVATIIFSYSELAKKYNFVSEKDIFEYVVKWKPQWKETRHSEICNTINVLDMFSWISIDKNEMLSTGS